MNKPVLTLDCRSLDDTEATVVDAIARLHLTLKRQGRGLRLTNASPELIDLIAFMGLSRVIEVQSDYFVQVDGIKRR